MTTVNMSTRISGRDDCGKKFFGMNWKAQRLTKKMTSVVESTMMRWRTAQATVERRCR